MVAVMVLGVRLAPWHGAHEENGQGMSYQTLKTGIWRLEGDVEGAFVAPLEAWLENGAEAVAAFEKTPDGPWRVDAYYRLKPDMARLDTELRLLASSLEMQPPQMILTWLDDQDWLAACYAGFPPLKIGRFFIHGSHIPPPPKGGLCAVKIDAAIAFGSGEHASTAGCLQLLSQLAKRRRPLKILDMGCGSGILAIAAAKLFPTKRARIVGIDIDSASVAVAQQNSRLNQVARQMVVRQGVGYRSAPLRGQRYDLIFANILARPLTRMAPALARHLAPGGAVILAGLLNNQAQWVMRAHHLQRLWLEQHILQEGWSCLLLTRRQRILSAQSTR
jgi:ribosomal protein L11 methyltransferase